MISNTLVASNFSAGGWISCRMRAAHRSSMTATARLDRARRRRPAAPQPARDGGRVIDSSSAAISVMVLPCRFNANTPFTYSSWVIMPVAPPVHFVLGRPKGWRGHPRPAGGRSTQEEQQNPVNREFR